MLKEMAASQAAKALALCVCPVVGAAAITVAVPKVRHAVHNATAPKGAPAHKRARLAPREDACPDATPVVLASGPLAPIDVKEPDGIAFLPELADAYPSVSAVQASLPSDGGFVRVSAPGGGIGSSASSGGSGGSGGSSGGATGSTSTSSGSSGIPSSSGGMGSSSGGTASPVPEPATWLQAIVGLGVAGTAIRVATRKRAEIAAAALLPRNGQTQVMD